MPRKISGFVFLYHFDVNIQKVEANSLVLPFPTESQPRLCLLCLGSHFLGYSVAQLSIPKDRSVCSGSCYNTLLGPQEEESLVSHTAKEYSKYSNPHYLLL